MSCCCFHDLILKDLCNDGREITAVDVPASIEIQIRILQPDMVLPDRWALDVDSFELMPALKRRFPEIPLVVYLIRNSEDLDELEPLIRHILQGNR